MREGQISRIRIIDVDTGQTVTVDESREVLFEAPNWTKDDALIVNGDGVLWTVPVDGTTPPARIMIEGLPEINNDHVLAPDHRSIYLSANDGHLYTAALSGGVARRVTPADATRYHFLHGIHPDGSVLAYVAIDSFQPPFAATLRTITTTGTDGTALTHAPGIDDGPEYSPDGQWLYFNTERFSTAAGHAQIARTPADGTDRQQLTFDDRVNWFPHLAPTGTRAVYLSFPPGTVGHPADLPVQLRLVRDDAWEDAPVLAELFGGQGTINVNSWSPDGTRLAFVDYPLN